MFKHCCCLCGSTERAEKSNSGTCISYGVQLNTFLSFLPGREGRRGEGRRARVTSQVITFSLSKEGRERL